MAPSSESEPAPPQSTTRGAVETAIRIAKRSRRLTWKQGMRRAKRIDQWHQPTPEHGSEAKSRST